MPELPDVEAVIKRTEGDLRGRTIDAVKVLDKKLTSPSAFNPLTDKKISGVSRRGKFILVSVDGHILVIHLRMTGDLATASPDEKVERHTRLILGLSGNMELRFMDQRRLGIVKVVPEDDLKKYVPALDRMGPEPLSPDFTLREFRRRLSGKKAMIKSALLDQSFIAGIGNIYGDEILFQSGIRPRRVAADLTDAESKRLYDKIKYVLRKACEHDADLSGFQRWFVRGRKEGRCPRCGTELARVRVQGRYSYYCPGCQR